MDRYEDFERSLDPHRADEQAVVAAEVAARLRDRGVTGPAADRPEDLRNWLGAGRGFEAGGEGTGGARMAAALGGPNPNAANSWCRAGTTARRCAPTSAAST